MPQRHNPYTLEIVNQFIEQAIQSEDHTTLEANWNKLFTMPSQEDIVYNTSKFEFDAIEWDDAKDILEGILSQENLKCTPKFFDILWDFEQGLSSSESIKENAEFDFEPADFSSSSPMFSKAKYCSLVAPVAQYL